MGGIGSGIYTRTEKHKPMLGKHHSEDTKKKLSKVFLGKKISDERRQAMVSSAKRGSDSPEWKGNDASYGAKHVFIISVLGKADHCSFDKTHTASRFNWCNVSGSYLRELDDWIQLCPKCHKEYDIIRRGYVVYVKNQFMQEGIYIRAYKNGGNDSL